MAEVLVTAKSLRRRHRDLCKQTRGSVACETQMPRRNLVCAGFTESGLIAQTRLALITRRVSE